MLKNDTFNKLYGNTSGFHVIKQKTEFDMHNNMTVLLLIYSMSQFTVYILLSIVGLGSCTMQAIQQRGGHGGNFCLQFLGRLHGNYTGNTGKQIPFKQRNVF